MASLQYNEFDIQLINARTGNPIDDDTGVYQVLSVGTPTDQTIYATEFTTTAASNPGTMTNGRITFYCTATTVDVTGMTASGHPFFIKTLTLDQHRVEIDVDDYSDMVFIVPFEFTASASATSTDSGFDLNALHVVKDVKIKVTTAAAATNCLCVGGSAHLSTLLGHAMLSATGFVQPQMFLLSGLIANTQAITALAAYGPSLLGSITNNMGRAVYAPGVATNIYYKDGNLTAATGAGYIYLILDKVVV